MYFIHRFSSILAFILLVSCLTPATAQLPACDQIPLVQCDSIYTYTNSGFGQLLTLDIFSEEYYGPEQFFKFRAASNDELFLTAYNLADGYHRAAVVLRDSALYSCFDSVGPTEFFFTWSNDLIRSISLGQVEAGHTYYITFDRWADDLLEFGLRLSCPDACPYPRFLSTDKIGQNHARLQWQNNALSNDWELELGLRDSAFTGIPNYSGTGTSVEIVGLQAFTRYQWRVRNICPGPLTGAWSSTGYFVAGPNCDSLISLTCGEYTRFDHISRPEFRTECDPPIGGDFRGSEVYANLIPAYDGEFMLGYGANPFSMNLRVMRSQLDQNCTLSPWICLGRFGSSGPTWVETGYLKKDTNYIFALEFDNGNHTGQWFDALTSCPNPCIKPDSLYSLNITPNSVDIGWSPKPNQTQWEVRLMAIRPYYTDTLYFLTDTPNLTLENLNHSYHYRWQVRGICGATNSQWSDNQSFAIPLDCTLFPTLSCGDVIQVPMNEGFGFLKNGSYCNYFDLRGYDEVLRFEVGQNGESRYLIGPEDKGIYWRKKLSNEDCLQATNWVCLIDSMVGQVAFLRNLSAGEYEILIKQELYDEADTVQLQLLCSLPCNEPLNPFTQIKSTGNGYQYLPVWTDQNGPWTSDIELKNEQGQVTMVTGLGNNPQDLNTLFSLTAGQIYDWRVRKICQNGTISTNWTAWTSFQKAFDCPTAPALVCGDTFTFAGIDRPVVVFDECEKKSDIGYTAFYRFTPPYNGEYQLDISNTNGQALKYVLVEKVINCGNFIVLHCDTVTADGTLNLGQLLNTKGYYLFIIQDGTIASSQTFKLHCPCPAVTFGSGILHADSTASLHWEYLVNTVFEIELLPVTQSFTGTANYWSDLDEPIISGLDPMQDYHYRFRPTCAPDLIWSDEIDLNREFNCNTTPWLTCSAPIDIYIGANIGLIDNPFGFGLGSLFRGQERFLRFYAPDWGFYTFQITRVDGNADIKAGLFDGCTPGGNSNYIPLAGSTSVLLSPDQEYTLVIDNREYESGRFLVSVQCVINTVPQASDEPFSNVNFGTLQADSLGLNEPCQTFSNRLATSSSFDPDPSVSPGNWLDGSQNSVWFYFDAPESETVQVRVNSDSMNPQVTLLRMDSIDVLGHRILATGENQVGSTNAMLIYSGLTKGQQYLLMVDGAMGTSGDFCIEILDEPVLSGITGVCETFIQAPVTNVSPEDWINLYANDGPINGPLLAAIQTSDYLGAISVSTEIHPEALVLSNGQKILPRYFNIEPEIQPINPVKLRLFFTAEDLATFNLTPPVDTVQVAELGITHYDGGSEDCDPENNQLGGTNIPVSNSTYQFVGHNGVFYLETTVNQFSEFGAAIYTTTQSEEPEAFENVRIFPVPTNGQLSLELFSKQTNSVRVEIAHITGITLLEETWRLHPGSNLKRFEWLDFPAGTYQLTLKSDTGRFKSWVFIKL